MKGRRRPVHPRVLQIVAIPSGRGPRWSLSLGLLDFAVRDAASARLVPLPSSSPSLALFWLLDPHGIAASFDRGRNRCMPTRIFAIQAITPSASSAYGFNERSHPRIPEGGCREATNAAACDSQFAAVRPRRLAALRRAACCVAAAGAQ